MSIHIDSSGEKILVTMTSHTYKEAERFTTNIELHQQLSFDEADKLMRSLLFNMDRAKEYIERHGPDNH